MRKSYFGVLLVALIGFMFSFGAHAATPATATDSVAGYLSASDHQKLTKYDTEVLWATSDTLTADQSGLHQSIATNDTLVTLPDAATGLHYGWSARGAYAYSVKPASTADTISYAGLSAGDRLTSNSQTADSLKLYSAEAGRWEVEEMSGTFTDGN